MPEDFLTSLSGIAAITLSVVEAGAVPVASLSVDQGSSQPGAQDPIRGLDPYLQLTAALAEASTAVKLSGTDPRWVVKYLGVAVIVIQTLEYLNGFGSPNHGEDFHGGSTQFDGIYQTLADANPDPSQWFGAVAELYATLNKGMRQLVHAMLAADDGVAQILTIQSYAVEGARDLLALYRMALVTAIWTAESYCRTYEAMVSAGLYADAEAAAAACCRYGYVVASAAVGGAFLVLGVLTGVGTELSRHIVEVKDLAYREIYDTVHTVIDELINGVTSSGTPMMAAPELADAASAQATQTVFTLQNARMPWPASSRPYPDRLTPPNGSSG